MYNHFYVFNIIELIIKQDRILTDFSLILYENQGKWDQLSPGAIVLGGETPFPSPLEEGRLRQSPAYRVTPLIFYHVLIDLFCEFVSFLILLVEIKLFN